MIRFFAQGLDHPEGIAVGGDGSVYCGGEAGQVYRIDPLGKKIDQIATTDGFCLGITPHADGRIFVCDCRRRALMCVEADGKARVFADACNGQAFVTPNFCVFDSNGYLYLSDSGNWESPGGAIYRVAPDGTVSLFHAGPFHFANGLALDANELWLYVVESTKHRVIRLRTGGANAQFEVFATRVGRVPDGLALDAAGDLYVTCFASDQIYRVKPDGLSELLVEDSDAYMLNRPTNCAFVGDQLYVANLGGDFVSVLDVGVHGMPLWHQRAAKKIEERT